jgi:hypothetical protein
MSSKIKLIIIMFVVSICGFSQTNHPTISSVTINYKSVQQSTVASASLASATASQKKVASIIFNLVDVTQVKEISYKIVNASGAIESQASYNIVNTKSDKANNGRMLFRIDGSTVYINAPQYLDTGTYTFQITTTDLSGISSPIYSSNN